MLGFSQASSVAWWHLVIWWLLSWLKCSASWMWLRSTATTSPMPSCTAKAWENSIPQVTTDITSSQSFKDRTVQRCWWFSINGTAILKFLRVVAPKFCCTKGFGGINPKSNYITAELLNLLHSLAARCHYESSCEHLDASILEAKVMDCHPAGCMRWILKRNGLEIRRDCVFVVGGLPHTLKAPGDFEGAFIMEATMEQVQITSGREILTSLFCWILWF